MWCLDFIVRSTPAHTAVELVQLTKFSLRAAHIGSTHSQDELIDVDKGAVVP